MYLSKNKISDNEGIADILFRIYQLYANDLSFIYTFRTWILYYSGLGKDGKARDAIVKGVEGIGETIDKLENALSKCT